MAANTSSNIRPMSAIAAARARLNPPSAKTVADLKESPTEATEFESENESFSEDSTPSTAEPLVNFRLCDWLFSPKKIVSSTDQETTLKLDQNESITHIGSYTFVVLQGRVSIEGVNAFASGGSSVYHVDAPTTRYISRIKGLAKSNTIRFGHVNDQGMRKFSSLSPLYRRIWNAENRNKPAQSFVRITESKSDSYQRSIVPEMTDRAYQSVIDDTVTNSKSVMVCGARNCGKTALSRRLANAYLTGPSTSNQPKFGRSVLYLDLDPSTPEFTLHGQLSLVLLKEVTLGPSFTHPSPVPCGRKDINELIRAHPFPYRDFYQYSSYFYACARDLMETARSMQPKGSLPIPIVINTPSWTSFSGLDYLTKLIHGLFVSRIIYIDGGKVSEGSFSVLEEEEKQALTAACETLPPNPFSNRTVFRLLPTQIDTPHSSHEDGIQRSMQMISYFHCTGITMENPPCRKYDPRPLSFAKPWILRYDSRGADKDGCIGFLMLGDSILSDSIGDVLNTSLVQIIETNDPATLDRYGNLPRSANCGFPYFPRESDDAVKLPDPKSSKLLLTALIRAWDGEGKSLLLLVPESHRSVVAQLDPKRIIIVFGCCDHPEWALTEDPNWDAAQRLQDLEDAGLSEADSQGVGHRNKRVRFGEDTVMDMDDANNVQDRIAMQDVASDVEIPPWVLTEEQLVPYRHLNVPRRTRRFHQ